ncbi:MAG: ribulose-phosphate 3-epimerase [Eubacteriales bacterium]|nr:ribulose-phosphate 3-epimerase [Eubacteriales bacterium]
MITIAPSILAADPLNMGADIRRILEFGIDTLHIDIMDAHFVPNLSYGPSIVQAIRGAFPNVNLDVHLMMDNPSKYIDAFSNAGADEITVHVELDEDIDDILTKLKSLNVGAGLSIKPKTPVEKLKPYLDRLDLILVMSVEPGFGGQKMMPETLEKLSQIRTLGYKNALSIDGGINENNAGLAIKQGADRLVMGTAVFKAENLKQTIEKIQAL